MKQQKKQKSKQGLAWYQKAAVFFFDKPRFTVVLWALLLMFGAGAYTMWLQREGFPEISVPVSSVSGTYLVNDKEKVDSEVSHPLTSVIEEVDGVTEVATQSGDNFFSVQVFYEESIDSQTGSDRVEDAVKAAGVLPDKAEVEFTPIFASGLTQDGDDLLIAVAGKEGISAEELQQKAESVASELQQSGQAPIEGAAEIRALDLFRTATNPITGEEVKQQTQFDWVKSEDDKVFLPSAVVAVKAQDGVDALTLYDNAAQSLEKLQGQSTFNDVKLSIAGDFATLIRAQTNSLEMNMLGGLLAVALISFLFISLRASLVSALSMITTLALTVGGLYLIGETLNTITLFALILCLGLIVDDATIMIEAIDKRRRKEEPRQAVTTAVKKIAAASASGTLTTVLAFAPLLFIGGIMGDFIMAIPVTIIMSLIISLIVSLTLVPFLARFTVLRQKPQKGKLRNPMPILEEKIANGLQNTVRILSTSRKKGIMIGVVAITISLVAVAGSFYFAGRLPFNIFPATKDSDTVSVALEFPAGTTIEQAEERSAEVNERIEETLGDNLQRASYYGSGRAENARVTLELTPYQQRDVTSPELAEQLNKQLSQVDGVTAEASADGGPAPSGGFTMQIRSEDGEALGKLAKDIESFLQDRTVERPDGSSAKITQVETEGLSAISRTNGERYVQIDAEYDADDVSALVLATQELVRKEFADEWQAKYNLDENNLVFDVGQEAENQESFNSMMIAFPILLVLMYALLALQFRSLSQPLLILLALPFSLLGVTMGLYYTNNAFSFFVMLGLFALMGIAVNNTILLIDYANQERRAGYGRIEAIARALHERFRPLLVTTLTTFVALVPLMLTDPFWESLAVTLAFGLLSSTVLVLLAFPYYYLAVESLRKTFTRTMLLLWIGILVALSLGLPWIGLEAMYVNIIVASYLIISLGIIIYNLVRGRQRRP